MTTTTPEAEATSSEIFRTTIRELMAQTGHTLDDMTADLGPKVARAMDGHRFDVDQLAHIAEWLGVDPHALLGRPGRLPECPPWCWASHGPDEPGEGVLGPLHAAPKVTYTQGRDSVTVDVFWQPGATDGSSIEPRVDLAFRWDDSSGDSIPASLLAQASTYVAGLLGTEATR